MKFTQNSAFEHGGNNHRIGILVTNLGTPDSCKVGDVRRYLKEFLSDPRVVETPRPLWWLILNLAILTTRPRKSAAAYQKIWSEHGSPLLVISRQQQRKLEQTLSQQNPKADSIKVELGMRYGNPSIAAALANLKSAGIRKLLVLPLYPQYCAATTASTFDAVCAELSRWRWLPAVRMVEHYHDDPGYLRALANSVRHYRQTHGGSELLLMSFHGIPQAYFDAGDPYHCECQKTARLLAEQLGLEEHEWQVSFQSQVGRKPWLQPYTTQTLTSLAAAGVGSVQVICPGFSADCLETLEEIEVENRDAFMCAGGKKFGYIPCLNDGDEHIRTLSDIITRNLCGWTNLESTTERREQKKRAMAMGAGA